MPIQYYFINHVWNDFYIVTAITIVALGMSLPDILGACMVTRGESHADEAMIHIAGSIAVKVLMGVGLPWFVAAVYHYLHVNTLYINLFFLYSGDSKRPGAPSS